MNSRILQPSDKGNLLTNESPLKRLPRLGGKSLKNYPNIEEDAPRRHSALGAIVESSPLKTNDGHFVSHGRRKVRQCRFSGSYADNGSSIQNVIFAKKSRKTPRKSLPLDTEATSNKRLSITTRRKSGLFVITENDDLRIKLRRQSLLKEKACCSHELKKALSPPKKSRQDQNLDEESDEGHSLSLNEIKHLLHTCEVPEELPCREEEYERIFRFIESCVKKNGFSQTMYICGVPGTGKTATVMQALNKLKRLYCFKVAFVNAMELINPKKIYTKIYSDLFAEETRVAVREARRRIDNFLECGTDSSPVILVIDELDLLCNGQQEIVYDLFNWTEKSVFPIGIIAIANTFDLHERFLARRIISRMGTNRIQFQPYKREEIVEILEYRLKNCEAVQKDAVELASRKVAAVSGDLRKALDIIRQAIQITVKEGRTHIGIESVLEAIRRSTSQIYIEVINSLSIHSRMVLRAALSVLTTEKDHFLFCELYEVYQKLCSSYEFDSLSPSSIYSSVMEMCSLRLLIAAPGVNTWTRKLRLGLTAHDVRTALELIEEVKIDEDESELDV